MPARSEGWRHLIAAGVLVQAATDTTHPADALVVFAGGWSQLTLLTGDPVAAFAMGVAPFLVGDLLHAEDGERDRPTCEPRRHLAARDREVGVDRERRRDPVSCLGAETGRRPGGGLHRP
mgnify:CR=1 FL=1